jgi:glycosyltransferase involved in cell wall biosynthesis
MVDCGVPAEKVDIVHSGVDPDKFPNASNETLLKEFDLSGNEKIIGNIAHLAGHKGQRYLIDAFAGLAGEQSDVRLFIVGHGELEGALKKQAGGLGLEGKVVFTGFRKDIGNFYRLFDVFVISSHLEGLCTSILDALVMKTPVVATDAGGIPEIIKDGFNGRLVKKKDPQALRAAIKDILTGPKQADIYTDNGYKYVCENFDYHLTAKKTYDIYKGLLD